MNTSIYPAPDNWHLTNEATETICAFTKEKEKTHSHCIINKMKLSIVNIDSYSNEQTRRLYEQCSYGANASSAASLGRTGTATLFNV